MNKAMKSVRYSKAQEIEKPSGFVNAEKVSIQELIGKKVILVDFWTYSCINCQRTIPYLNDWYRKYKDAGLEIVGIHTPEFEFEKKYENVSGAVKQYGIEYPVVLDNGYGTWYAYNNRYWPRKYLIDIDGFIVYDHIGEGDYEETEGKIQELLKERAERLELKVEIENKISDLKLTEEAAQAGSPEIYFGAARNTYLGNGESGKAGTQTLIEPTGIKTNILYLVGDWDFDEEFTENKTKNAKIIFRYQAKNVYFVASAEKEIGGKILLDGKPLTEEAGADVERDGSIKIKADRLYKLVRGKESGEHTLEMQIEDNGLKAFTFTFG